MWITKGTLLGLWLFSLGNIAYLWRLFGGFLSNTALDLRTLGHLTVSNPSWWLWAVVCLAIGLISARNLPGRPILWGSIAIMDVVPLAYVALILVVIKKAKA